MGIFSSLNPLSMLSGGGGGGMGSSGGGINNGAKVSTTASEMTDARSVLGNGAASNSGAGSVTVFNSTSSVDPETIKASLQYAAYAAEQGAQVASGALSGAFLFGTDALGLSADAISANGKALSDSLDFGSNAVDLAVGGVSDAYRTATVNALDFGGNAMDMAMSGVKASNVNALNFGGDVFNGALGGIGDALVKALGFGSSALSNSLASSDTSRSQAFGLVDSVVSNSIGLMEDQAAAYRKDTASLVDKALAQVTGATDMLGNAYADSQGRGAYTDKMLMLAIGGAVLIAAAAIWKR